MTAKEVLQRYWHYDAFRPLQGEIIESVLCGRDTLALMPTGGGKSLCFQVPTMVMAAQQTATGSHRRLCLVITPLIALMKDQVENLKRHDILAAAIYTGMTYDQQKTVLDNCLFGPYHFLYVSPERLESEDFRKRISALPICLIAVDEAHCISQWGYDFRPSYLQISAVRHLLPDVPILALTATATPDVVEDIQERLAFREKNVLKKSFHRANLHYVVRHTNDKEQQIIHILSRVSGSAIIYVRNRKRAQELTARLLQEEVSADYYHAGLNNIERSQKQEAWKNNSIRVMVCTNAFGMGIDKPDVRLVIHHDLPDTLEAYYQEAGRAGRDGKRAFAVLLYHETDKSKARKRITDNYPSKDFIQDVYHKTFDFLQIALGCGQDRTYTLHIDRLCQIMHLPVIPTYSSLHLLAQAGYIRFEDSHEISPRVQINISPSELSGYALHNDQRQLLDALMRQYTGIFTELQYVNDSRHDLLVGLAQRGIITYIPRTVACTLTPSQNRVSDPFLPSRIYDDRRTRYSTRLKAMVEYAEESHFCREQILLAYFGEHDAPVCGHCDVCLSRAKADEPTSIS